MSTARDSARPSAYRYLVFGLLAAAYFMVYFHRTSPAVVALDMMADLKADAALLGVLASAYFYPYALMQLPAGLLSDSWGPRRTITVFFLVAGAASIAFGMVSTVGGAIVARIAVGLGVSMLFVPTLKVMTNWFTAAEFSRMMGILMAVGGLGVLSAATPLAYLSAALGWRGSFIAIGIATLALAGVIWVVVRNRPEEKGFAPVNPTAQGQPRVGTIPLWQGVGRVLSAGPFWAVAAWFFFTCGCFFAFAGLWGGPYLMHVFGLTKPQAGNILSMAALSMIFGSPLMSWLSDKIFVSRKIPLVICAVVTVGLMTVIAFFPAHPTPGMMYAWVTLLGLAASASVVVAFTHAKELFPVAMAGTSVGLVNLFPFLGGAVWQVVIGLVLKDHDKINNAYPAEAYGSAFIILFACSLAGLVGSLFIKDTLPGRGK